MERVTGAINGLLEEYAFKRTDEHHVALVPHGRGTDDGFFYWGELTEAHRRDALANGIDWEGFTASEKSDVIMRVLDGENRADWMNGIKYYNPEEDFPRPLTRKQHAAYLADIAASYGMTVEEMDDYYKRMEDEGPGDDDLDRPMADGAAVAPEASVEGAAVPVEAATREEAARRGRLIGRIGAAIGAAGWDKMTRVERAALLEGAVDRDGFDAAERFDAIENVLAGKDRARWLEGIATRAERDAREDATWAEAARRGNGSPNSEPYFRRDGIGAAQDFIAALKRTEDFVRLDNGHVVSEWLDRPEGDFTRLGAWDRLEERDKLGAVMLGDATEMLGGGDIRALLTRAIDFTRVPRDEQRRWLGEVYEGGTPVPLEEPTMGTTTPPDPQDIGRVTHQVQKLLHSEFKHKKGGVKPCSPYLSMYDDPDGHELFSGLSDADKRQVLTKFVDWSGFDARQRERIVENVLDQHYDGRVLKEVTNRWFEGAIPVNEEERDSALARVASEIAAIKAEKYQACWNNTYADSHIGREPDKYRIIRRDARESIVEFGWPELGERRQLDILERRVD
jgi:hypothetical protein